MRNFSIASAHSRLEELPEWSGRDSVHGNGRIAGGEASMAGTSILQAKISHASSTPARTEKLPGLIDYSANAPRVIARSRIARSWA